MAPGRTQTRYSQGGGAAQEGGGQGNFSSQPVPTWYAHMPTLASTVQLGLCTAAGTLTLWCLLMGVQSSLTPLLWRPGAVRLRFLGIHNGILSLQKRKQTPGKGRSRFSTQEAPGVTLYTDLGYLTS